MSVQIHLRFDVPALDRELGLEVYLTNNDAIGGRLRLRNEDFVVEEIPLGYSSIEEFMSSELSRTPSRYENFAICLLEKHGIDTIQAATILAERLHLREEEIGYSGLKDAKAITRQLISIPFRRPLQREYEFPEGIRLQLLGFRYRPLSLGELSGNQFGITTRIIALERDELAQTLDEVSSQIHGLGGFPGYFGYQRFGSRRPISHLVGRMLAQGNIEQAVKILLTNSSQTESSETRAARENLASSENYDEAADYFPHYLGVEKRVLQHLRKHPTDFAGALKKLPMRLNRLFLDAYQSFLYNKALSRWLRERKALKDARQGDLVASFDAKGYVKKLTKVSLKNHSRISAEIDMRRLVPILALPAQLVGKSSHPISREVSSILEDENLAPLESPSKMSKDNSFGIVRPIMVEPENLGWIISEDEISLGSRRAVFHFRLKRGFYATILMREFLKPADPLTAGF